MLRECFQRMPAANVVDDFRLKFIQSDLNGE